MVWMMMVMVIMLMVLVLVVLMVSMVLPGVWARSFAPVRHVFWWG